MASITNVDFVIAVTVVIILFVVITVGDRLIDAMRRLSLSPLAITSSSAAAWWLSDNKQAAKLRNRGKTQMVRYKLVT
jgi:hypothetical protein